MLYLGLGKRMFHECKHWPGVPWPVVQHQEYSFEVRTGSSESTGVPVEGDSVF